MSEASYRNGRGRSPSPSRSPDSRAGSYNREPGSVSRDQDRERELAEQLRNIRLPWTPFLREAAPAIVHSLRSIPLGITSTPPRTESKRGERTQL
ncbi:hypothetical protein OC835_001070 [Tilletia horrida]|nr:hypothetical protein OC835_001070 [Tilletia horrida]